MYEGLPMANIRTLFLTACCTSCLLPCTVAASGETSGLHTINKFGMFGYIRANGQIAIPLKFNSASEFSEGFAPVAVFSGSRPYDSENEPGCMTRALSWGFIDTSG